jgi:hypothetical protein
VWRRRQLSRWLSSHCRMVWHVCVWGQQGADMEFLRAGFKIASTAVYSLNKVRAFFSPPSKLARAL